LTAGDQVRQRPPAAVDGVMDLDRQSAPRLAIAETCRFTLGGREILVFRPSPRVLLRAGCVRPVLVGATEVASTETFQPIIPAASASARIACRIRSRVPSSA